MPSLRVTVLSLLSLIQCFLSLKIPEEHDLESQIRKEREWRFLRNTRVRKQAQQVIQKGKCTSPPRGAGLLPHVFRTGEFPQPPSTVCAAPVGQSADW